MSLKPISSRHHLTPAAQDALLQWSLSKIQLENSLTQGHNLLTPEEFVVLHLGQTEALRAIIQTHGLESV